MLYITLLLFVDYSLRENFYQFLCALILSFRSFQGIVQFIVYRLHKVNCDFIANLSIIVTDHMR